MLSPINTMQGADWRARRKRSRIRAAPTPTTPSTKSEPLCEKNGTPLSPAVAFASSVFPVPVRKYVCLVSQHPSHRVILSLRRAWGSDK